MGKPTLSTQRKAAVLPVRWGSEAQATHCREGEAGHNVSLVGTMGDTQESPTISTASQGIAARAAYDSGRGMEDPAEDGPPLLVGESSLGRIRMLAEREPNLVFISVAHRIDLYLLKKSFRQVRKSKSAFAGLSSEGSTTEGYCV